ncbi:hypothetical protein [Nocardia sp. AG03]|uniref:hypothetical protein n=1 Tax=Nocardia sp. AG03 TaxID=3025312 RepID=UPI0024188CB7|nr:hypothetical protein [Nocardia sp. AG03]
MISDSAPERRFLVSHDYGMGGAWWWISAHSAREIEATFAEVQVVEDPDRLATAATWNVPEVDIDAVTDEVLLALRADRDEQRRHPGFGAFADRDRVYLNQRWDGADDVPAADYLTEVIDGYRIRQVEVRDDGPAFRSGLDDFVFNPPIDLWDPELVDQEITAAEFEKAWAAAEPMPE